MRSLILFLVFNLLGAVVYSQNESGEKVHQFAEGVYLSFQDFKHGNPVPLTHIFSDFDIRDKDYLDRVLAADSLIYYDNLFEERAVSTLNIWGYRKAGKVYIGFNTVDSPSRWDDRGWFPILNLGAYSYFTAMRIVSRFIPPTPGAVMQSRGTILDDGAMYQDDGRYYDENVPVQMLLDFSNGELIQLATGDLTSVNPNLVSQLITSDKELLGEYKELSRRDQKQSAMFYIRKFNERHPVYFTVVEE